MFQPSSESSRGTVVPYSCETPYPFLYPSPNAPAAKRPKRNRLMTTVLTPPRQEVEAKYRGIRLQGDVVIVVTS